MLQQKKQLSDLSGECFEGDFHLCSNSSRCTMFLSTIMKIVLGRKETMGTTKWCFAQDSRLSEEAKAVAQRLGMHEIQLWYITALQMSFFFSVWQL